MWIAYSVNIKSIMTAVIRFEWRRNGRGETSPWRKGWRRNGRGESAAVKRLRRNIPSPIVNAPFIQRVPELADQTYSAFSLVITEINSV
jgi:hypothetical protein